MSENRDYYEVLGVDKDADARTIKRAFLKKARIVHPDVSDDPDAEAKFKELNEAYSVLSDEQKRANYDRYGSPDGPGGSGYVDINDIFGGMGMDDLFSSFFGGGAGGGARNRRERRRGRDMAISLSVTLEEAALGCKKTISYDRLAPCDDCNGTGRAEGAAEKQCSRCHGTGYVTTCESGRTYHVLQVLHHIESVLAARVEDKAAHQRGEELGEGDARPYHDNHHAEKPFPQVDVIYMHQLESCHHHETWKQEGWESEVHCHQPVGDDGTQRTAVVLKLLFGVGPFAWSQVF